MGEDIQQCQFKLLSLENLFISPTLPPRHSNLKSPSRTSEGEELHKKKRVSDGPGNEFSFHSVDSSLSTVPQFGATVLTPEQQLRRGRVHLLPSSTETTETKDSFTSAVEKRAKELVLEPAQEYMRTNIARALVENQKFRRRNSVL